MRKHSDAADRHFHGDEMFNYTPNGDVLDRDLIGRTKNTSTVKL